MTAIFCVVLGHIGGITSIPWLVEIIYSFHMALFLQPVLMFWLLMVEFFLIKEGSTIIDSLY